MREGRRRRHKRHKARAKQAIWRRWTWHRRGLEFWEMINFVDRWNGRGAALIVSGPDEGRVVEIKRGQEYFRLYEKPSLPVFKQVLEGTLPDKVYCRVLTYKVVRVRQQRMFYQTVRRIRELSPVLEFVK